MLDREAVIPISQRLLEQMRRQQVDVARPYTPEQRHYRRRLARWPTDCEIRDTTGRPVHVTPHQFRDTLAT